MGSSLRSVTRRDLVFALFVAVLSILCADFFLWGGAGIAAAVAAMLLCLTSVIYQWPHRRQLTGYGAFCVVACAAGAGAMAVSDDGSTKALVVIALIPLSALAYLELMHLRAVPYPTPVFCSTRNHAGDICYALFVLTFGRIGRTCYALFHRKDTEGSVHSRKVGSVLLGLACAIPVLLIIVPLLMSSDAAFEGLLDRLDLSFVFEAIFAVLIGILLFLLVFGRMLNARYEYVPPKTVSSGRGLESVIITSFLSMLSVVYVVYLITQLAYFFSAFEGLLPKDYTVAEYARRGFFEMAAICAINLGLIFLANLICRKKEGRAPMPIRLLSTFICVFSLVLVATALSKMFLYIGSFGMTRQRILTSVFMLFLGIVFLAVIARMFLQKTPWLKIAVVAGAILLIATCYADVDRVVAGYNVHAYQSGKLDSIDMEHLGSLESDAALPYIFELIGDPDPDVSDPAQDILERNFFRYYDEVTGENGNTVLEPTEDATDWRSFNLATIHAKKLLWENRALFLSNET